MATETFQFQGHWLIEIVRGDPSDLVLEACERRDGHAYSNKLGMTQKA